MRRKQKAAMPAGRVYVGYARVSTDKQADHGVSLDAQAEKIQAMAVVHGVKLADIIIDGGESASSLNRPGIAKLLAAVDAGLVQTVFIAKLDRLTRSVRDLGDLLDRFERRGVALVSVAESLDTSSAAGRLVLNVMAAVSQWEREAIGERTRDALNYKRSKREVYGEIPYGFDRVEDDLRVNPGEMKTARRIIGLIDGGIVQQAVADALNRDGIKTKKGNAWVQASVGRVLKCRDLYETAAA